jgi:DNA/RNA-binding domain of Phe-tRNA-synthetase-like protein
VAGNFVSRRSVGFHDRIKGDGPMTGYAVTTYENGVVYSKFRGDKMGTMTKGKWEVYKGIGKFDLNLEGLPVFSDNAGPHGSPTSDSERTMVTAETKQVLAIIVSFGGPENLDRWTQRLASLLQQYAAGTQIVTNIVL